MKRRKFDEGEILVFKVLAIVAICSFFAQFGIPGWVTSIFIALGYLAYTGLRR